MRRLLLALLILLPLTARAQTPPPEDRTTLVADSVTVQSDQVLVAKGHVEVFYKTQHMTATEITYDRKANRLVITGPIRIEDGTSAVFVADQADLSADLTEGLLTSARIVLDQKLQLAAGAVLRSDGGRYTTMRRVVASSCTICKGSTTPLWEIRAREVVHDAMSQQIWFSDATLRFVGVPVLYIPILRVPDPSLTRATGFLIPSVRSTNSLGTGLKLPYFITLGPSRDLLVTPYFTIPGDRTVALRYRQAFSNGTLQINTAVSRDHIKEGATRGYLAAIGQFDLGHDYKLALNGIVVSGPAYLSDYGISDADRLDSTIALTRVQRNLYFSAEAIGLHSIRAGESNVTNPTFVTDMTFHRRFLPPLLGGEGEFEIQTHSHYRPSNVTTDTNGDGIADGRDMARVTIKGDWRRNWTLSNGIMISTQADAEADFYTIGQDAVYAGTPYRGTGTAAVELRWPWVKAGRDGTTQLIEPVVQLVSSPISGTAIPNEDSTLVEFDESNLFALDRFPGTDAYEGGTRLNVGMNYLRTAASGWSLGLTAGRVLRFDDFNQFSAASGLQGRNSNWMVAWTLADARGLSLTTRTLIDDNFGLTKGEMRFDYTRPRLNLSGGYEFLRADPSQSRTDPVREIVLDSSYEVTRFWNAHLVERYDLVTRSTAKAGLNLTFRNECLAIDLSVSRSNVSSTSVNATTDFGLSVELLGFGGSSAAGHQQVCRR
ncbi:LPS assembly protein LptD [bacterium]|nr:LPS assembly protein LptD [bacterium]